ncbi:flagellin, partial [Pseudomonadales bacterium]|nr:flagellin [Pseudomonadales bacterium]
VDESTQSSGYSPTGAPSQSYSWSAPNADSDSTSIGLGSISFTDPSNGLDAIASITAAIETITAQRAEYGAMQNRLQYTISNLTNVSEQTTIARSRIEDADFATESAALAKAQVLQQSGAAMLAQANARPQLVLQLVK